jgi:hypothetical protein
MEPTLYKQDTTWGATYMALLDPKNNIAYFIEPQHDSYSVADFKLQRIAKDFYKYSHYCNVEFIKNFRILPDKKMTSEITEDGYLRSIQHYDEVRQFHLIVDKPIKEYYDIALTKIQEKYPQFSIKILNKDGV